MTRARSSAHPKTRRTDAGSASAVAAEAQANIQAVGEVLRALRKLSTPQEVARAALEAVRKAFGWSYGSYWEIDPRAAVLRFSVDCGDVSPDFRELTLRSSFAHGVGVSGRTWATGQLTVVEDLGVVEDCVRAPVARRAGVRSGVCFPITLADQVVGTMDFFALEPVKLSASRKQALVSVAELVSGTLERIRDQERTREQAENASAVATVLEAMAKASSEREMIERTLEAVRSAFAWHYGSYWVRSASDERLHFRHESGVVSEAFRRTTHEASFARAQGVNGRAWAARDLIVIDDLGAVTDCVRAPVARQAGISSGVCFPVLLHGEVIATMDFFSTSGAVVSEARLSALRSVARLVSSFMERIGERHAFTGSVQRFAGSLDAAASDLTNTVSEQSATAQELAASVGQVSSSLGELRAMSAETLRQAEIVIGTALHSTQASSAGSEAVERAIESMRSNLEQVSLISERILQVNEQTARIANIVAAVTEIAAQSKLLALNAAIESARAGEHGRGFSVVAREMTSLAEQSRAATAEVRQLLAEIQLGTKMAVTSAAEGIQKARVGMELAERCGENIAMLSRTISHSSSSARLIAHSARQQDAGIGAAADALVAINQATVDTAHGLRQTREATKQLKALSLQMQSLFEKYAPPEPALAAE
jgi:methyl-accepting chemotaxis protein/GAF domain-containing protein